MNNASVENFDLSNTGCGKSALIKAIAGIWTHKDGTVSTWKPLQPPDAIFIPQTPYLSSGTIVDQVIYPLRSTQVTINREQVLTAITAANLSHLLDRFDTEEYLSLPQWNELSPGEKQRIYFARLFYHRPILAVLDEATSSTDEDTEIQMYQKCIDLTITLLSVGHRSSLKKFHKKIISINRGGGWSLKYLD
ncbi:ATP-binding cassette sub-family D member 4-like isoform X1 [Oopsacas minuta]|uniref:ATP-binding cassette sub-family D member 4-like isoform X1 n=1 Tax=Oopsacas minuta TaxID=111878 RepID=A0AAV7KC02_9METZ|nr:ATP-binding cassette sub-family D member 4-like isoform X1 [Oopsacas minuta]